jgi:phosphoglycolate phosphatase
VTSFIAFDLDGTLVDSRRDIADSANEVLQSYGHPARSEEAIGSMVGDGAAVLVARTFAAARAPVPPDALERFLEVYSRRLVRFTRPYQGIPELLERLAERAVLAVLTNKPAGATVSILEHFRLTRFFGNRVLGGDGPLPRKPSPAGLLKLIGDAVVPPSSAVMVGDSVVDVRTARAAGARACVTRYGFGFTPAAIDALQPGETAIDRPLDLLLFL